MITWNSALSVARRPPTRSTRTDMATYTKEMHDRAQRDALQDLEEETMLSGFTGECRRRSNATLFTGRKLLILGRSRITPRSRQRISDLLVSCSADYYKHNVHSFSQTASL
jgi:hypothetical protein